MAIFEYNNFYKQVLSSINMVLMLNKDNEYFRPVATYLGWTPFYKEYVGIKSNKIHQLIDDSRVPLSIFEIMKRRIDTKEEAIAIKSSWFDNYFDSSDFVIYPDDPQNNKIKILLSVDNKSNITSEGKKAFDGVYSLKNLDFGHMYIGDLSDELKGIEISKKELGKLDCMLRYDEIMNSKLWRIISRNPDEVPAELAYDQDIFQEYVDLTCFRFTGGGEYKDRYMGCFLSKTDSSRMISLRLSAFSLFSNLYGEEFCENVGGRFVGFKTKN